MRRNSLLKRGFGWGVFLLLVVAAQAVSQTFKAPGPLNPRSKDLQTVSPPTPAVKERKLPTKPQKVTSDLSIERIYVRGCQVYITVANRGKAGLSLRDYNNGRLSLTLQWQTGTSAGLEPRVFTLKQVDPKGALGRPGGWVEFNTRVWGRHPNLTIRAKLERLKDDRGKGRKELRQVLSVPERCLSKTSSGTLRGAAVRSPAGKGTYPQGKGLKGLSLTPLPGRASDLSIERVYLRDCKVQVLVKNRGSAGVTDEDYRNGELRVKLHWRVPKGGGRTHTFALSQVDTHRVLKRPGMSVDFNTGISLGASEIYHVTAELVNLRHDLSQEGQKKLTQDLILPQQCLSRPRKPGTRKPSTGGFPRPKELEKTVQGKPLPERTPGLERRLSSKKLNILPEKAKKFSKLGDKRELQHMSTPPTSNVLKGFPLSKTEKVKEIVSGSEIFAQRVSREFCPQQGKAYYYKHSERNWGQLEISENGHDWNYLVVRGCNWPNRHTPGYESYKFSYKLVGIDDGIEIFTVLPEDFLPFNERDMINYFYKDPPPSGRRYQVVLTIRDRNNLTVATYRTGIFTLNWYNPEKFEFGEAEGTLEQSAFILNPFVMEFRWQNENLMSPGVLKAEENVPGKEYSGFIFTGLELNFRTEDGSYIQDVCNYDRNRYSSLREAIRNTTKLITEAKYLPKNEEDIEVDMDWAVLGDNFIINRNEIYFPDLTLALNLIGPGMTEITFKIEFCGYTFSVPKKIVIYDDISEQEAKPLEVKIERITTPLGGDVQYLTPDEYILVFNTSKLITIGTFVLYYFDPVSHSWLELNRMSGKDRPLVGSDKLSFSLKDLAETYVGNKVKFKLDWINSRGTVIDSATKEYAFKNLVILHPKLGERLYVGRPYLITWLSTDKSGQVEILCGTDSIPGSGRRIVGPMPDTGSYLWTPTHEFVTSCRYIKIIKPGSFPFLKGISEFQGVSEIGIKIINPTDDILAGPVQIVWDLRAPENERGGTVSLYYRIRPGALWQEWILIADDIPASNGFYNWVAPTIEAYQKDTQLKIIWNKPRTRFDSRTRFEDIVFFRIK